MKPRSLPIGRIWSRLSEIHNNVKLVHLLLLSTIS